MMRHEQQQQLNRKHVENPQEGDYWHEMFCPYFIIIDVDENGVWVLNKTISVGDNHFTFVDTSRTYMTLEQLKNAVTYETMRDKFVADVMPRKRKREEPFDIWGVI